MRIKALRLCAVRAHYAQPFAVQVVIVRLGRCQVMGWLVISPGADPIPHLHRQFPINVHHLARDWQQIVDGVDHLVRFFTGNTAGDPADYSFDRVDKLPSREADQVRANFSNSQRHLRQREFLGSFGFVTGELEQ